MCQWRPPRTEATGLSCFVISWGYIVASRRTAGRAGNPRALCEVRNPRIGHQNPAMRRTPMTISKLRLMVLTLSAAAATCGAGAAVGEDTDSDKWDGSNSAQCAGFAGAGGAKSEPKG